MELGSILEKVGALDAKLSAAHQRVDRLEIGVRDDLRELKQEFKDLRKDVKALTDHMNRGKGWAAAMLLLAGSAGAGFIKLITLIGK